MSSADSYLTFDFNNVDVNYLLFEDLDLNLTGLGTEGFIETSNGTDLNYIVFSDSIMNISTMNLFYSSDLSNNFLNFDFGNADKN